MFFWGHEPSRPGVIGKACFSQWWPSPFVVDGVHYPTAQHYISAEKARMFGDAEALQAILSAVHPSDAAALEGLVDADETVWARYRMSVVTRANREKFRQNIVLGAYLAATGVQVLAEASPIDRVWGIGLAEHDRRAANPAQWPGLNLLGFALMDVRDSLSRTVC